jgi:phosphatidylserine/phosphatidylglycerophosphate/cardiolipin synthase-like enzyme
MPTHCVALSNNDLILVAWTFEQKLAGCLGFDVRRIDAAQVKRGDATPQGTSLPALAGFPGETGTARAGRTTAQHPVQKFFWKDLYVKDAVSRGTAAPGASFVYQIVPLQRKAGTGEAIELEPLDGVPPLFSNEVGLTVSHGPTEDPDAVRCYFNRGILATQAVAHALPAGPGGGPSKTNLLSRIADPADSLRKRLASDLLTALPLLLDEAKEENGECHGALYELSDPQLVDLLSGNPRVHLVLSNTFDKKNPDGENAPARKKLHDSRVDVTDRILADSSHIGHNKFLVYRGPHDAPDKASAVLTGSTNWTSTGLCAQTNNSLILRSPSLASAYLDYWNRLKTDTTEAAGDPHALQGPAFRTANASPVTGTTVPGASRTTIWFSPNTHNKNKSDKVTPPDMTDVYARIGKAQSAVLFLAFDPGLPSVIDATACALAANGALFVRGALTNAERAGRFEIDLHNEHTVASTPAQVIPATGIDDAFGVWEKELNNAGHAVIHDKIVVIDPFDPERCTVIVGSHNLGNKASSTNDENLVILEGNVSLACAYAIHVLDVYDHYRWRYLQAQTEPAKKWQGLTGDDTWQAAYFDPEGMPHNAELAFWLGAPSQGASAHRRAREPSNA